MYRDVRRTYLSRAILRYSTRRNIASNTNLKVENMVWPSLWKHKWPDKKSSSYKILNKSLNEARFMSSRGQIYYIHVVFTFEILLTPDAISFIW